jgi:RNA polymerase sigma factor (sigma-70 family)
VAHAKHPPLALSDLSLEVLEHQYCCGTPAESALALAELMRRFSGPLLNACRMLAGNDPQQANDLYQELFVHLRRVRDRWDPNLGNWYPWARRVLGGIASGFRRGAKTEAKHLDAYLAGFSSNGQISAALTDEEQIILRDAMKVCLSKLEDRCRAEQKKLDDQRWATHQQPNDQSAQPQPEYVGPFLLWHIDDLTMKEIANRYGVQPRVAREWIRLAEEQLRLLLIEHGFDDSSGHGPA